ncbi:hypothetical protein MBCUT_02860 [Methanobrevibacter cuticularis]|uniref:Glycerophosphoryl diester phosphodiesterase membrane domain-containing protein n=1 Tax=Methanobrevibacter cuticularis TaxID=47311 RepID=A0A166F1Z8_9EURY|nr:DUF4013 domain-containing protein [Methanobrevibacter cuticularis]KZX17239.1 hypothetical protein MBCUT_02860 [Methanobrevibacter cuticularis]
MNIVELFKDSLTYPTKNWNRLLILGVLVILSAIFYVLEAVLNTAGLSVIQSIGLNIVIIISAILALVLGFIISGYEVSIIRKTIENSVSEIPAFEWVNNIVDGIKVLILHIVYYIIPVAVILVLAFVLNIFGSLAIISANIIENNGIITLSDAFLASFGASILGILIVAIILFIIFSILLIVAIARLAETNSLGKASNFIEVFKKISQIGWGNFIVWLIGLILISIVIGIIMSFIMIIPIVGVIIAYLFFVPYTIIFSSRAIGLIYNESKE